MAYDASGNLTRQESHLYRYDAFDQASQVDYPNWTYLYTADTEGFFYFIPGAE